MFFIKTRINISQLHGLGLFADEPIAKGALVYRHLPGLDLHLTEEAFQKLDSREQKTILHYGYVDKNTGLYRLDHDDIRFINDSYMPNIGLNGVGDLVALADISPDEELTQAYNDFEVRRFCS